MQESEEVKSIMTLEEEIRIGWNEVRKEAEAAKKEAETAKKELEAAREAVQASQERLNTLNEKLLEDDRLDDLKKAIRDSDFRESLFKEYGL